MHQSFLSVSYPLTVLDEIVLKTIVMQPGIIRSYLIESLAPQHGVTVRDILDSVSALMIAGLIAGEYGQPKPAPTLRIEQSIAYLACLDRDRQGGAT